LTFLPLLSDHRNIVAKIFPSGIFVANHFKLKTTRQRMATQGMSNQSSCNIELYPSKLNFALQNPSLGEGLH
jgi:hypothetical protein